MSEKRLCVEYSLIMHLISDRIKENTDENILRRLNLLLNDVKALSEIDKEEYDAIKHFVDDYD